MRREALEVCEYPETLLTTFTPRRDAQPFNKALQRELDGPLANLFAMAEEFVKIDGRSETFAACVTPITARRFCKGAQRSRRSKAPPEDYVAG